MFNLLQFVSYFAGKSSAALLIVYIDYHVLHTTGNKWWPIFSISLIGILVFTPSAKTDLGNAPRFRFTALADRAPECFAPFRSRWRAIACDKR